MAGPRLSAERCDYREKADEHRKVAAHRALLKGGCRTWTAVQAPSRRGGYPRSGRGMPKSRCALECRLGLEVNIIQMVGLETHHEDDGAAVRVGGETPFAPFSR